MKVMKNIPRLIMLAVLTLIAVVFVIPIFYSVFNSFKSQKEILSTTMTFSPTVHPWKIIYMCSSMAHSIWGIT